MDTVGERLKHARKIKGLTLNDIKANSGVSTGNLSEIENNKVLPSTPTLISICRILDISIDWLLTGEGRGPDETEVEHKEIESKKEIEGFEQILNFLSNIIKEGKLSREDLLRMLYELQYEIQDPDEESIYLEVISQYEFDMLQNYRLLSERDQGKVDGIIESLVPKSDKKPDKKKEPKSSTSDTSRDEATAGDETGERGIA